MNDYRKQIKGNRSSMRSNNKLRDVENTINSPDSKP